MSQYTLPESLIVGFQKRNDTYTKKLGFVTHESSKKLQMQFSWNNWVDKNLGEMRVDNKPMRGFVFNKDINRSGGFSGNWQGRSVMRVYHPLGFEFEIGMDNVSEILMHCDVSKRDIQEECVLAWRGKKLVLIPVNTAAYKEALTDMKHKSYPKAKINTLSLGDKIVDKNNNSYIFLGVHPWYDWDKSYSNYMLKKISHIEYIADPVYYSLQTKEFFNLDIKNDYYLLPEKELNVSSLIDSFSKSFHGCGIKKMQIMSLEQVRQLKLNNKQRKMLDKSNEENMIFNLYKMQENLLTVYNFYWDDIRPEQQLKCTAGNEWSATAQAFKGKSEYMNSKSRVDFINHIYNTQGIGFLVAINTSGEKIWLDEAITY